MSGRRGRGRAGKVVAGAVAVLAAAAAAAAAYGLDLASLASGDGTEAEASAVPEETAEITRQTLVETVSTSGDLDYGQASDLASRLMGTVTGLPDKGAEIGRGEELFFVDDTPVILMYGPVPAYRDLAPGVEGRDVEQFEENLAELGYDGFTADDEYTWKTAEAVREWQEDLGLPETGTVELGRVVFASGKVRVDDVAASIGDAVGGEALLSYSGLDQVVTVEVELEYRELVAVGRAVELTLPDGTTAPGTVADAETTTKEGDENDPNAESETVLEVTVAADDPSVFDGLDQAAISVGFDGDSAEDVLVVPVAALLALAEGGYGLEIVEGDSTRVVAVETGLFANGMVEVSGEDIEEGMTVGMPS